MKQPRTKHMLLIVILILAATLVGCAAIGSKINDISGSITGNTYTIDTFDNSGNLMMQTHGQKIDVSGNVVRSYGIDSDGDFVSNYELSSVLTITIDGNELESCGDTLIFYEDGLKPDVAFEPVTNVQSTADGILDNTYMAARINSVRNKFGKSRIVVVKSQLGNPIYAFSGDSVYWEIPDNLPKFTKLMVDGKALYLHRSNFQIIDKALLDR